MDDLAPHFHPNHWPKLGVGVAVFRGQQLLLGKRINAHGSETWSLAGGHVDAFESPEAAAIRELEEETGLVIDRVHAGPWVNVVFEQEKKHYVTFVMCARVAMDVAPELKEPDKCEGWQWFDLSALPSPLFLPLEKLKADNPNVFIDCMHAMDRAFESM